MNETTKTYSSEKNKKIAESRRATKERRQNQTAIVLDFKVKLGKRFGMSEKQLKFFNEIFIEGKRFRNYLLSLMNQNYVYNSSIDEFITEEHKKYLEELEELMIDIIENDVDEDNENEVKEDLDIFKADQKNYKTIYYYTKGPYDPDTEYKEYTLVHLRSYPKTSIIEQICNDIKSLSSLKKNGHKIGHLKYTSEMNSITFKKQDFGFSINVADSSFHLQGCPKHFKVWGIQQLAEIKKIDSEYEAAECKLIRHSFDDIHIHCTVYVDTEKLYRYKQNKLQTKKHVKSGEEILGIDFGCETHFALSNGIKKNYMVEESDYLKNLQRNLSRCKKYSNNYYRILDKIHQQYTNMNTKKDSLAKNFVNELKKNHNIIVIQDENLTGWLKSNHGNRVWHSILGRVKKLLLEDKFIPVIVLDRFIPTTKFCPHCGQMHKMIKMWDREYVCPHCGCVMDRDVHAAQNMVWIYENCIKYNIIPMDGREIKRADFDRLVSMVFNSNVNRVEGIPNDCTESSMDNALSADVVCSL